MTKLNKRFTMLTNSVNQYACNCYTECPCASDYSQGDSQGTYQGRLYGGMSAAGMSEEE